MSLCPLKYSRRGASFCTGTCHRIPLVPYAITEPSILFADSRVFLLYPPPKVMISIASPRLLAPPSVHVSPPPSTKPCFSFLKAAPSSVFFPARLIFFFPTTRFLLAHHRNDRLLFLPKPRFCTLNPSFFFFFCPNTVPSYLSLVPPFFPPNDTFPPLDRD